MTKRSNGTFVGNVLDYIIQTVLVFALLVFTTSHKVKKTRNTHIYLFLMRKTACVRGKFALPQRVVNASFSSQIV